MKSPWLIIFTLLTTSLAFNTSYAETQDEDLKKYRTFFLNKSDQFFTRTAIAGRMQAKIMDPGAQRDCQFCMALTEKKTMKRVEKK